MAASPIPGARFFRLHGSPRPGLRQPATLMHTGLTRSPRGGPNVAAAPQPPTRGTLSREAAARSAQVFQDPSSAFEEIQMVRHYRATDAEEKNDDGKAQRSLSHGDADREHREHHAGDIGAETRKRHQIDVDGIQHQLDAEKNAYGVAARHDAEQPDAENDGGERQVRL